nr:PREDICTED: complexin isoform X1 [Megachile rotundata]
MNSKRATFRFGGAGSWTTSWILQRYFLEVEYFRGAVGGEGGDDDDKEKEEEAERERQEAIREAEERRKEKHRKMEEEREKMRQEIRDKYNIKKREEVQEMTQEEPNPLMRKKKTPEELAAEAEAEDEDEITKLKNVLDTHIQEIKAQVLEGKCELQ